MADHDRLGRQRFEERAVRLNHVAEGQCLEQLGGRLPESRRFTVMAGPCDRMAAITLVRKALDPATPALRIHKHAVYENDVAAHAPLLQVVERIALVSGDTLARQDWSQSRVFVRPRAGILAF